MVKFMINLVVLN